MKKLALFVLVAMMLIVAAALADDKKQPVTTKLTKLSEPANLTCTLPRPDGTIVCHITVLDPEEGGNYECRVDTDSCHEGYRSALRPGQSCLGAIVCRPATASLKKK